MADDEVYEYGFYDSHPAGNWADEAQPQEHPTIWWYVFGMPHKTPESAQHTGSKSTRGQPIIVRRTPAQAALRNDGGPDEWEHVESDG